MAQSTCTAMPAWEDRAATLARLRTRLLETVCLADPALFGQWVAGHVGEDALISVAPAGLRPLAEIRREQARRTRKGG